MTANAEFLKPYCPYCRSPVINKYSNNDSNTLSNSFHKNGGIVMPRRPPLQYNLEYRVSVFVVSRLWRIRGADRANR